MRTSRLVALMLQLTRIRRTTVKELADQHGVSTRTIQRDIAALQTMGVPVRSRTGPAGGIGLVEGWRSPLTGMTATEVQALLLGEAASRELGLETEFQTARLKMLAAPGATRQDQVAAADRIHLDYGPWFAEPEKLPWLSEAARAVWEGRRITVHYAREGSAAEPGRLLLDPLGLVLKTNRWYLVAAHHHAVRTYRLSRIEKVEAHREASWRPENFSLAGYWNSARAEFEASVVNLSVRLSIPETSATALKSALPGTEVGSAVESAQRTPGSPARLELTLMTEKLEIVSHQLLGVPGIEVLQPPQLRRLLFERGKDLAACNPPC